MPPNDSEGAEPARDAAVRCFLVPVQRSTHQLQHLSAGYRRCEARSAEAGTRTLGVVIRPVTREAGILPHPRQGDESDEHHDRSRSQQPPDTGEAACDRRESGEPGHDQERLHEGRGIMSPNDSKGAEPARQAPTDIVLFNCNQLDKRLHLDAGSAKRPRRDSAEGGTRTLGVV